MTQNNSHKYVGKSLKRVDIEEKATGKLRYLGDMMSGGTNHAKLILSSVANGKVLSIDTSEAMKVPGVIKIYTPEDDPGRYYNSCVYLPDQTDARDECIFTDRPLYVGDRIGAVLAKTDDAARKATALIKVTYETFEPVLDPIKALKAASFREGHPQVITGSISYGEEHPLSTEEVSFETTVRTPRLHHGAMENHICQAYMAYGNVVVVESPCQMIFTIRYALATLFNMPMNKIRVKKAPMGGTFGGKQEVILEPACALIAMDTGQPVRIALDRAETIATTRVRAETIGKVRTVADRTGRFIHRDIDTIANVGAYATGGHRLTMAMGKKTSRLYRIPSQNFTGQTVFTNTTPSGAFRGYGSPQIHTVTEIHVDLLARKLNMDPADIRMMNLVYPGDDDPASPVSLGNARIRDCLSTGVEKFNWAEKREKDQGTGRYRTGTGLACCTHGNGYFGSPFPDFMSMAMRFCEDGTVLVNASLHELGNGTLTTIGQIVAEVLNVAPEKIFVTEGDTQMAPFDVGCVASRVTYVCGACAQELAEKLKDRFTDQIMKITGAAFEDVLLQDEQVFISGEYTGNYGDMVCRIAKELLEEVGEYHHYKPTMNPASYGVHMADVKVDTLTGLVQVSDFMAVHDVGKAINPRLLNGQIYGGVQMGIGMALTEDLPYDRSGNIKNRSLSRYHMVNAPDMPNVHIELIEEIEPGGPFGAKSIGEICTVPTAAAVVNAVNHALGTSMTDLPLTPEKVLAAIEDKKQTGEI